MKTSFVIKSTAILLAVLSVFSLFCFSAGAVNTDALYLVGDADGSGYVSIIDVTLIQQHLVGTGSINGANLTASDIDGNGLNISDATEIQRYLAEFGGQNQIGKWVTAEQPTTEWLKPGENELPYIPNY